MPTLNAADPALIATTASVPSTSLAADAFTPTPSGLPTMTALGRANRLQSASAHSLLDTSTVFGAVVHLDQPLVGVEVWPSHCTVYIRVESIIFPASYPRVGGTHMIHV